MVNLVEVLEFMYPTASGFSDYRVRSDVNGDQTIERWAEYLGPKPTEKQLTAVLNSREFQKTQVDKGKGRALLAVDRQTQELIAEGFTFQGIVFSLSIVAQMNWTNLFIGRTTLSYPLEVSTKDDGVYRINNANELATVYSAGVLHVKSVLDAGRELKKQIKDAVTVVEVNAITDNRKKKNQK